MNSRRVQIGQYFVEGTYDRASVVERRMGKDFVLESFDNKTTTNTKQPDAFERAIQWVHDLEVRPANWNALELHINWFDLIPAGRPNQWKSDCPVCENGLLMCGRDEDGVLKPNDRCLCCGQRFIYDDIDNMREREGVK